jgi:Putative peptidoglycan binding domain
MPLWSAPETEAMPLMRLTLALCAALLGACGVTAPPPPVLADLSDAGLPRSGSVPPAAQEGACWSAEILPARIETVTAQVLDSPARTAADGTLLSPATFRTETRQKITAERRDVWLEVPCDAVLTPAFLATLQRALKARGYYEGVPTATLDDATRAAVRAWQRSLGLDTAVLSMAGARALGLVRVAG